MKLRCYQQTCLGAIFTEFKIVQSTMVTIPTGGGKTVVFAHVGNEFVKTGKVLILVHREELLQQAKEKFKIVTGIDAEIERAEQFANMSFFSDMRVIVSTIQTQVSGKKDARRYMRFRPDEFSLVIVDECHHATSKTWMEVINHYRKNPKLKVLGVTATPKRSSGEALGQVFESCAFQYGLRQAIDDGYLVNITQQSVFVKSLDFSHIKTTAADLNEGQLAELMEKEENVQGICQPTLEVIFALEPKTLSKIPVAEWRQYLADLNRTPRRTIIFTVSVAQAEMCCDVFLRSMSGVEWVCGKTPRDQRQSILKRFASGEVAITINCGVLVEGFDEPAVEVIAMARPTKSASLYQQILGRAMRTLTGTIDGLETKEERKAAIAASPKKFMRMIDFCGNAGKHKMIDCIDVLGGDLSNEAKEKAKEKAKDGKPKLVAVTLSNAEKEIERKKFEAMEKARVAEAARKAHLVAKANFSSQSVNPFDVSDSVNSKNGHSHITRDGVPLKEGTLRILRQQGINPATVTRNQIRGIIAKFFETPSGPQAQTLRKHGYDPMKFNRKTAHETIDALAKNGWKKPEPAYTDEPF